MTLQNIQRILVIKLRAIGDVLLSTPVIQNLREHFPDARIDFLTEQFAADVVSGNPWLSNVITFDRERESSVGLVTRIRRMRYDLIIDLFCNPRSALITALSGSLCRVGFPFRGRKYAYNMVVPPRGREVHNVEFNLDALRRLDIPVIHFQPHFPLTTAVREFAEEWLRSEHLDAKPVVGLSPTGGWATKRWVSFAQLGDVIAEKYGASILLLWGPGEEDAALAIQQKMKHPATLIPKTSLLQLGAVIERCSYIVSNDSGPMHIAAALDVPTLGIFGPTDPNLQGPFGKKHRWIRNEGLECLGCNLTACPIGNICMAQLEVDAVVAAFDRLVSESQRFAKAEVHQPKGV